MSYSFQPATACKLAGIQREIKVVIISKNFIFSPLFVFVFQALEDELNQKKREQEMFFKLSEEADDLSPMSPNKPAKFVPFSSAEAS